MLCHLRSSVLCGALLIVALYSKTVGAHPHQWIDVLTEWQFNQQGHVDEIKLRWVFDDYYSLRLLSDAKSSGEKLYAVLDRILNHTSRYAYYLTVEHAGKQVKFSGPERAQLAVENFRVAIEFYLPVETPLDPRQNDIIYRIAEPTYYFEMLHEQSDSPVSLSGSPQGCSYQIESPRPDAALIAYAASLGVNESGGDELGIQFAETVTIRCH